VLKKLIKQISTGDFENNGFNFLKLTIKKMQMGNKASIIKNNLRGIKIS